MDITKNEAQSRYEMQLGGEIVGVIDYIVEGDVVDLPHTGVEPAHEGKGYAEQLAKFALEDIRAQGKRVQPTCPYIAHYIEKHPQYHELRAE